MKLPVHPGLNQYMILIRHLPVFVQLHRADLQNFKRNPLILLILPVRALVPFQIKDNVIHTIFVPSGYTCRPYYIVTVQECKVFPSDISFSRFLKILASTITAAAARMISAVNWA